MIKIAAQLNIEKGSTGRNLTLKSIKSSSVHDAHHYEITPMQYTEIIKVVKNENFQ